MKKYFAVNKAPKIGITILLGLAILVGLITCLSEGRIGYIEKLYPKATLSRGGDMGAVMEYDHVIETLNDAPTVFVVQFLERENAHEGMRSTVKVKQVLKGDTTMEGQEVILYENNYFATFEKKPWKLHYINSNPANLMNTTDDYLVFAEEKIMDDAYIKIDDRRQFSQYCDVNEIIALFNISKGPQTTFNNPDTALKLTYSEIQDQQFVSFSQKSLDNLNNIKNTIISEYFNN